MTIWFWMSLSVSEIFAAELRSRPKLGQILHVFRPRDFFGVRPPPKKILDRHYETRPSTDHRAKFQASRPTHLGDLMLEKKQNKTSCVKHKSFRKLLFSGGLKIQNGAVWHKNQNWREHAQGMSNQRYSFQLKRSKIKVSSSWDINSLPKGTLGSALC